MTFLSEFLAVTTLQARQVLIACMLLCCTCCAVHSVLYTLCFTCCTVYPVLYSLCCTCCALHQVLSTLCCAPSCCIRCAVSPVFYTLQAQQPQLTLVHQQLLVRRLQHLLAGFGHSACWGAAERQQRTLRLLPQHPLGYPWLKPLALAIPPSLAQLPMFLSLLLVLTSHGRRLDCSACYVSAYVAFRFC